MGGVGQIFRIQWLALLGAICLYLTYHHPKYPLDYLNAITPNRLHWLWSDGHASGPWWGNVDPPLLPGLRAAPWAGAWEIPNLRPPDGGYQGGGSASGSDIDAEHPALVMLHIFSMPSQTSRRRRDLIRRYSPLLSVPPEYRHLVELKFVLGHPQMRRNETEDEWGWDAEATLAQEQDVHGDLLRLDGLHRGENMNEGKSWEWLRHVGREGGRKAWWVLKCDDDTVPILPNLLPWLTTLDPTRPTYFGNPHLHPKYHMYYFEGMLYGFSWGVVSAAAVSFVQSQRPTNPSAGQDSRDGRRLAVGDPDGRAGG
ncbi:hypothetical protein EHS25_000923 [Saitozyma podzolica]|uniref:Hexosyltransferase n=1 Tax=Saitozyma podzolica TaxID=1890683 RepID=A0A427YXL9_9TREE|nr:hypothetical protein EHS25_000923 [Saitozyma podzolica]